MIIRYKGLQELSIRKFMDGFERMRTCISNPAPNERERERERERQTDRQREKERDRRGRKREMTFFLLSVSRNI